MNRQVSELATTTAVRSPRPAASPTARLTRQGSAVESTTSVASPDLQELRELRQTVKVLQQELLKVRSCAAPAAGKTAAGTTDGAGGNVGPGSKHRGAVLAGVLAEMAVAELRESLEAQKRWNSQLTQENTALRQGRSAVVRQPPPMASVIARPSPPVQSKASPPSAASPRGVSSPRGVGSPRGSLVVRSSSSVAPQRGSTETLLKVMVHTSPTSTAHHVAGLAPSSAPGTPRMRRETVATSTSSRGAGAGAVSRGLWR